jgi:hypothetical protein
LDISNVRTIASIGSKDITQRLVIGSTLEGGREGGGGRETYLAEQGLALQTGKAYLSALCNTQIFLDSREQSSLPLLKQVQAGMSRTRLQKGQESGSRLRHRP